MSSFNEQQTSSLARQMESPGFDQWRDDHGRDAFDALMARFGWSTASRIWDAACTSFDWKHAPEEFPHGRPAQAVDY